MSSKNRPMHRQSNQVPGVQARGARAGVHGTFQICACTPQTQDWRGFQGSFGRGATNCITGTPLQAFVYEGLRDAHQIHALKSMRGLCTPQCILRIRAPIQVITPGYLVANC